MRDGDIIEVNPTTTAGHVNIPLAKVLAGEAPLGLALSRVNIFRSEEHVKNWSLYDSVPAESIMPLSNWAPVFSGPLFRNRLEPDYLSLVTEYASVMFLSLRSLGKAGPFWTPE